MVLLLLHASNVLLQAAQLAGVVTGVESQELGEPCLVGCVLHQPQLDAGTILLPELLVAISFDLLEHVQGLAYQLLLDDLEQLVLLESLARHVEGKVVRVHL